MKSSEFHRKIRKEGWRFLRAHGSHIIYEKDGRTYPVPYHGSKEMSEGLRKKILREMKLK